MRPASTILNRYWGRIGQNNVGAAQPQAEPEQTPAHGAPPSHPPLRHGKLDPTKKATRDRERVLRFPNLTGEASSAAKIRPKPDKYSNFQALADAQEEGRDFSVSYRNNASHVAVIAPHGGKIEPGTSEIALAIAGKDWSYYVFQGLMPGKNGELHITSDKFDEPRCLSVVQSSAIALAIHGARDLDEIVYLGGRLGGEMGKRLSDSLKKYGFNVGTHPSPWMQGKNSSNICNRGKSGMGVQLELSSRLRQSFFASLRERDKPTPRLAQFAAAVREGLAL